MLDLFELSNQLMMELITQHKLDADMKVYVLLGTALSGKTTLQYLLCQDHLVIGRD